MRDYDYAKMGPMTSIAQTREQLYRMHAQAYRAASKSTQNIVAPVLASDRGYDDIMLPPVADSHEMPAARPMDHAAVPHRGVKPSAPARGGASGAPVALLIA